MTFVHPLGLLGLIGIPILIIIYIIKTQYTEQTVSSTFIWTLSEKFLKKRNPLSKVAGIISLILQILTILTLSLAIAHPVIILPDAAQEYCLVIDASASMSMTDGESTRLDRAKAQAKEIIDGSTDGSVYTLVVVGETTYTVFEHLDNKKQAMSLIDEVEPAHTSDSMIDAIGIAQGYFDENNGLVTYLFTDKTYLQSNNVNCVNVAAAETNISLSDVVYELKNGIITVKGNITAFTGEVEIELSLYSDADITTPLATLTKAAGEEKSEFVFEAMLGTFEYLRITANTTDALSLDNEFILYNKESESLYSTLIVSDRPFFIQMAFDAVTDSSVAVVSTKDYAANKYRAGLYIFDSYTPEELPKDAAVWFINPLGTVKDSGFSFQSKESIESGGKLTLSTASSSLAKDLRDEIPATDINVSHFTKCGLYKEFTTLYSYQGNPIIFAGTNNFGNRQVVFALDFHESDIVLTDTYIAIMRNLIKFSFPDIIEKTDYFVGETLEVNVVANCESIRIETPSNEISYLDTSRAVSEYKLTEAGTYTLTVNVAGTQRVFRIYAAVEEAERNPVVTANSIELVGEAGKGGFDGKFDMMMTLFIVLAVLFFADWGVYCYEKHQLR